MKSTTTILYLLALGSTSLAASAALPSHSNEARWCVKGLGRPCWKVKRAADNFASTIASLGPASDEAADASHAASHAPGGAAFVAKRHLDRLAGIVASTQDAPAEFYNALDLGGHFEPDTEGSQVAKRDAHVDARWCTGGVGRACWKVRRAAESVVDTIEGFEPEELSTPGFAAGKDEGKLSRRDGVEARCSAPGGECARARRDLAAMYHAARSVLEEVDRAL